MIFTRTARRALTLVLVGAALAVSAGTALADDPPSGPPPALVDACGGKTAGAACTVAPNATHPHALNGVCGVDPKWSRLLCRPQPPKPRS
jgi:hypothetical protein